MQEVNFKEQEGLPWVKSPVLQSLVKQSLLYLGAIGPVKLLSNFNMYGIDVHQNVVTDLW